MSEPSPRATFAAGLREGLKALEDDPEAATTLRRLARRIARDTGLPSPVRSGATELRRAEGGEVAQAAEELLALLEAPDAGAAGESTPPRRALLVQGDDQVARTARIELESLGLTVTRLTSGEGVLQALRQEAWAVVVLDLILPDQDGRDLMLDLSEDGWVESVPLVAISPSEGNLALARSESLALGADAFLERRDVAEQLASSVGGLLESAGRETSDMALLRRSELARRFRERSVEAAAGGVVALLVVREFRNLARRRGTEAAEEALLEFAVRMVEDDPEVQAVGRWDTDQLVVLVPELGEAEGLEHLRTLQERLAEADPADDESVSTLAASLAGALVPSPEGTALADRVREADRVRLGISSAGSRLREQGDAESPPTILVVEDDAVTAHLVVHKLEHAGFEVRHFDNGDHAARALDDGIRFNLALFDINLPGQDGFQLVRRLRERDGPTPPIVILSGMGSDDDVVRGLELGADDYILKPFSPTELTARVRRLLAGAPPSTVS